MHSLFLPVLALRLISFAFTARQRWLMNSPFFFCSIGFVVRPSQVFSNPMILVVAIVGEKSDFVLWDCVWELGLDVADLQALKEILPRVQRKRAYEEDLTTFYGWDLAISYKINNIRPSDIDIDHWQFVQGQRLELSSESLQKFTNPLVWIIQ